jgi:hypothetical protein
LALEKIAHRQRCRTNANRGHRRTLTARGIYRYYMTKAGRAATAAAERLTEGTIIPALI